MADKDYIEKSSEFGPNEEKAIIALAFEVPEFFETINQYVELDYFQNTKVKFAYALIDKLYKQYESVPGRQVVRDYAIKELTVDDDYDAFLEVIDYELDPRDIPIIKGELLKWARSQAYMQIFTDSTLEAYYAEDYDAIEDVIENAKKVTDFGTTSFNFFERYEEIFKQESVEHFTTAFPSLDRLLHGGGPTRKEVVCWMAPTGTGKSMALVNMAVANILRGKKVLHVTCEMRDVDTAARYAGCFTNFVIDKRFEEDEQKKFKKALNRLRVNHNDSLMIHEYEPNEASANHISALIDSLKTHSRFVPDIVIVDYLDLIKSRVNAKNMSGDDYTKHKSVSEELRGLAFKHNVIVVTATQTNRSGVSSGDQEVPLDVDKVSESYGKTMALDYMISLQQSKSEYNQAIPEMRLYISKNRNGPRFKTVNVRVKYVSSKMMEYEDQSPI